MTLVDTYAVDVESTVTNPPTEGDNVADSPLWWRKRLLDALVNRAKGVQILENWYDGKHPLPSPPDRMTRYPVARNAFEQLSRMGVTNYVSLVPDAPADRLQVTGFRFGDPKNIENDTDTWTIWQRNHLDADSRLVQHKALTVGNAFALVWPNDGKAEITVEHPAQAIVAYAPGSRRNRVAGLKCWCEDDGTKRVVLYLPSAVYKWRTVGEATTLEQWRPSTDSSWPITNPFGEIPLVEFRANADLRPTPFGGGCSEFAGVLPIQERINKTVFDRMVTAEFQAFRQRYAVGWEPDDPNTAMRASMANILTFKEPDVKVGDFAQADFTHFIKSVESDVQSMAAITRTPTFYTLGSISNISGDTLAALQAGLVAKCEAHRDNFSEDWEEVLRLSLKAEGNARAADVSTMVVWRPIEHYTWAEIADAALKLSEIDVPREALWLMLKDVTPQDVERWKIMAAEQELFAPPAANIRLTERVQDTNAQAAQPQPPMPNAGASMPPAAPPQNMPPNGPAR